MNSNPLDEDDDTYLMTLCLIEYVLDEVNLMYLQWVQKGMKKEIQNELDLCWKEYVSGNTRIGLGEVAYARGKERAKSRMGKSAQKVQNQG